MLVNVELECPVCEHVIHVESEFTWCSHCHARFMARLAIGGGYVFECETSGVEPVKVTRPAVVGGRLFQVVNDRVDREWLVKAKHGGVLSLELFLSQPLASMQSHTMKV